LDHVDLIKIGQQRTVVFHSQGLARFWAKTAKSTKPPSLKLSPLVLAPKAKKQGDFREKQGIRVSTQKQSSL
ncbi:MAG: hypothetical protein WAL37_09220, partial [Xanthobacteraceae bacterium]